MTKWRQILLLVATACGAPRAAVAPAARGPTTPRTPAPAATVPHVLSATNEVWCGDGKTQSGETCDDGNTLGGDGCSGACRREPARFLGWDHVLLGDGTIVSRTTGQALPGRVTLVAPEAALLQTQEGLRYFSGGAQLSLPPGLHVAVLGAGLSPCLLNDAGEVYCPGGALSPSERPHFEHGVIEDGQTTSWNKLRHLPGAVTGLAGNLDVGCILLDGGTTTQCWRRETFAPWSSISGKLPLGQGRLARQIVAGSEHFCVLSREGDVGCWGDSSLGQTGYMAELASSFRQDLGAPERNRRTPPAKFMKLESPAKQLAASGYETCALLENGKLWCWGDTDALAFEASDEPHCVARMQSDRVDPRLGPLPKPLSASTLPRSPVKLPNDCKVKDFSLVSGQLCVSCQGGCSKCWGQSDATLDVKAAEPPSDCLAY